MSASVYDIFASIHLRNLVSPALLGIIRDVDLLKGKIGEVNKSLIALGGALGVAGGVGIFAGLKYAVDKAKELNHELVQAQKLGLSPTQYNEMVAATFALHSKVPGITSAGAQRIYGQAYSPLGHENAIKMLEPLAKFVQVLGAQTGDYKAAEDKVYSMIRAGDLMGKFMNSVTHQVDITNLEKFLDLGARVITATHGRVSADTWFALAQQGGPALSGMSDEGLLSMAMVSQAMGGHRAGTALSSIFQQLRGGTMTQYRAKQFHDWGFVGDYTIGRGGHMIWGKDALDPEKHPALKALQEDPLKFGKMLMEKLAEEKGKDINKQIPMLYQIFQRQTSIREMHDIIRNMTQMEQERPRIAAGLGISSASSLQNTKDYSVIMHNFTAAWDEFMAHLGTPVLESMAIPALKSMTSAIDGFTEWAKKNQSEIFEVAKGLTALGAALLVLGGAAVVAVLAPLVGVGGLIAGLATAIGLLIGLNWDTAKTGFNAIREAIDGFIKWLDDTAMSIKNWVGGLFHASYAGGGGGGDLIQKASYGGGSGASFGGSPHGSYLQYASMIKNLGGDEAENLMKIYRVEGPQGYAIGDHGRSFGPFQVNIDHNRIGAQMLRAGINVRDPASLPRQIEWLRAYGHRTGVYSDHVWFGLRDKHIGSLRSGAHHIDPHRGGANEVHAQIHSPVYLDGKMIASNTVTHVLKSSEHSRQSAYFDGYHSFAGADRQTSTA